jgi:hypothetical protein
MRYETVFDYGDSAQSFQGAARGGGGTGGANYAKKEGRCPAAAPLKSEEIRFPDFAARARRTWSGRWKGASSDKLLDESRSDR